MRSGVAKTAKESARSPDNRRHSVADDATSFSKRGSPRSRIKAPDSGPHFAWDPQAECGFLREDLCELPVVFSLSVAAL